MSLPTNPFRSNVCPEGERRDYPIKKRNESPETFACESEVTVVEQRTKAVIYPPPK